MSALAELALAEGAVVSGSDLEPGAYTAKLKALGARVFVGHAAENLGNAETVVYSSAIGEANPELAAARERGLPCLERFEYLGKVARAYENVIAVSGAHGKTTVTAMTAAIFIRAGLSPTVHIGGNSPDIGGNLRIGGRKYFITEACEYRRSFLSLSPRAAVISNVALDHPDTYRDLGDVQRAFERFALSVPLGGMVAVNADDPGSLPLLSLPRTVSFGIRSPADYRAVLREGGGVSCDFTIFEREAPLARVSGGITGIHNVYNALAAAAAARFFGIDGSHIAGALSSFRGVGRRFEAIGALLGTPAVSDYAHHPDEICSAAKEAAELYGSVTAVFQPHTYSRTLRLMDEFAHCFRGLGSVGILPVYSAREAHIQGVSEHLTRRIKQSGTPAAFIENEGGLRSFLAARPAAVYLFLGAGSIDAMARRLVKEELQTKL